MREIKYRYYDAKRDLMGLVMRIDFTKNFTVVSSNELSISYAWNCKDGGGHLRTIGSATPDKLMQFTGLLDKNGKEVYEDDIISGTSEGEHVVWQVTWFDKQFCWYPYAMFCHEPIEFEIIGNIHQNPELLND